jgi:hypothetical protein
MITKVEIRRRIIRIRKVMPRTNPHRNLNVRIEASRWFDCFLTSIRRCVNFPVLAISFYSHISFAHSIAEGSWFILTRDCIMKSSWEGKIKSYSREPPSCRQALITEIRDEKISTSEAGILEVIRSTRAEVNTE